MGYRIHVTEGTVKLKKTKKGTAFWQGRFRWRVDKDDETGEWKDKAITLKEFDGKEIPLPTDAKPKQGRNTAERALRKAREEFLNGLEEELDTPAGMDSALSSYADMDIPDFVSMVIDGLEDGSIQEQGKRLRPSTIKDYRKKLKHIRHYFGGMKVSELTHQHINAMKADMVRRNDAGERMGDSLRRKTYVLLNQAYGFAELWGVIDKSPFDKTTPPAPQKSDPHPLDEASNRKLKDAINAAPLSSFSVAVKLAMQAGMRIGEICGLQWRHVDFKNRCVCVRLTISEQGHGEGPGEPKTPGSIRDIPMFGDLYETLRGWHDEEARRRESIGLDLSQDDYVIGTAEGFKTTNALGREMRTFADMYNLKETNGGRCTFHGLRDTCTTRLVESGADVNAISKILGHSDPGFTLKTYADVLPKAKRNAVNGADLW